MTFLQIPGYNTALKNRPKGLGGGVAIIVCDSLNFIERADVNLYGNESMESLYFFG